MNFSSEEVFRHLNSLGYNYEGDSSSSVIKGLCPNPYHNDRNIGSFVIWPEGGACKCYSCGWTGDFIKFVQDYRGLNFREALDFVGRADPDFSKVSSLDHKKSAFRPSKTYEEQSYFPPPGFPSPGRDFRISEFSYLTLRGYSEEYKKQFGLYYCDRASYEFFNVKENRMDTKWVIDYMVLPVGSLWEARDIIRVKPGRAKTLYPKTSSINNTIFNLENLRRDEPLYLTEGAGSHPKIWTYISKNSSFVFGAVLSEAQLSLLREFEQIIWIPDPDKAGLDLVFQVQDNLSNSLILDILVEDKHPEYVRAIQNTYPIEPFRYILRKHDLLYG